MMDDSTSTKKNEVGLLAEQKAPPHGFKGHLDEIPFLTPRRLVDAAMILLVVVILSSLLLKMIQWWRRRAKVEVRVANSDAQLRAWQLLKSEIEMIQIKQGEETEFANQVSLCLRRGVEIQTSLPLPERTNQEIKKILLDRAAHLPVGDEILTLLGRLDEVRFAGSQLEHEEALKLLKMLKGIVFKLEAEGARRVHKTEVGKDLPRKNEGQIF
jgi:hypothetical protein